MSNVAQLKEIERILGRSVIGEKENYNLSDIPENIATEASIIANDNKNPLLAMLYLRHITGAELKLIKAYADEKKWSMGILNNQS